jgi:hypothetical protein
MTLLEKTSGGKKFKLGGNQQPWTRTSPTPSPATPLRPRSSSSAVPHAPIAERARGDGGGIAPKVNAADSLPHSLTYLLTYSLTYLLTATAGSWGVYQESVDAFEVDREPGTVQMSYVRNGNEETAKQTTGLLLLPPKKRGARLEVGTAQLTMVGTPPTGSAPASPDGLRNEYIGVDEFEKAVGRDQSGMAGSVMDDGFEGMLSRDLPQ